jgi:hypothetical protein
MDFFLCFSDQLSNLEVDFPIWDRYGQWSWRKTIPIWNRWEFTSDLISEFGGNVSERLSPIPLPISIHIGVRIGVSRLQCWRRRRVGHDLWALSQKRRVANTKPVEFWWCRWILLLIFAWSVRRGCGFRIWNLNSIDENRRGWSWGYGLVDPNELNGAASNRWTTIRLFHLFDVFDGCGWLRMTNAV